MSLFRSARLKGKGVLAARSSRLLSKYSNPSSLVQLLSQIPEYDLSKLPTFSRVHHPKSSHINTTLPQTKVPTARLDLSNVNPSTRSDSDQDIGRLFLGYFVSKAILSRALHAPENSRSEISKEILSHLQAEIASNREHYRNIDIQSESDTLCIIGALALSDQQSCINILSQFISQDFKGAASSNLSTVCDSIFPEVQDIFVDYSPLAPRSLNNDIFQLPKMPNPEATFHALYFVDVEKVDKLTVNGEDTEKVKNTRSALLNLTNHGKYLFEWYSINCIIEKFGKLGYEEVKWITDMRSNASKFVRYSCLHEVLPRSLNATDDVIFLRYLALLDLSGISLKNWFVQAISKFSQSSEAQKDLPLNLRKIQVNSVELPQLSLNDTLRNNILEFGKLNENMRKELERLGEDFLDLTLTKHLMTRSIRDVHFYSYLWKLSKKTKNSIDYELKHNANVLDLEVTRASSPLYIGLFSLMNPKECEHFINKVCGFSAAAESDEILLSFKSLAYDNQVPHIIQRPIIDTDDEQILRFPILQNRDKLRSLMLVNCSLIVPNEEKDWLHDLELKNSLIRLRNFGRLLYKTKTKRLLLTHMPEGAIEYFTSIDQILNSTSFFNFVLRKSSTFSVLNNKKYEGLLLRKRFNSDLSSSQFAQYISCLYFDGTLDSWVARLSQFLVDCIRDLSHEEVTSFISGLKKMLYLTETSLSITYKQNCFERISGSKVINSIQPVSSPPGISNKLLEEVGEKYVIYLVNKFNTNQGLGSFLASKREMLSIFKEISRSKAISFGVSNELNMYQYLTSYLLTHDEESCEKHALSLFQEILNRKWKPLDERNINSIKADVSLTTHSLKLPGLDEETVRLPQITVSKNLDKLLLVNYNISRSYLDYINSNDNRNPYMLPDICTKFNSVGLAFYEFSVYKYISLMPFDEDTRSAVIGLLLDRKFTSIVAYNSGLGDPFSSQKYQELSSRYVKNTYFTLRFYNQAFNQFVGLVENRDRQLASSWVASLCHQLKHHLDCSQKHKIATIQDIHNDVDSQFSRISS